MARATASVAETARPWGARRLSSCLWLPGRELRVGGGVGKVLGRGLVDEADHCAVDVGTGGAVGGTAGAGDQVGPRGGQVEDNNLVDLALVEALLDRLLRPLADLRVPERTVCLGVARIFERR